MCRRGFTVTEVIIASATSVLMLTTLVSLFYFCTVRSANAVANAGSVLQAQILADELGHMIRNSVSGSVQTHATLGRKSLRLVMPTVASDTDGNGAIDTFQPSTVSRTNSEKYGAAKRVWFYMSDATGLYDRSGNILWRAEVDGDGVPTSPTERKRAWGYYYTTNNHRYFLVDSIDWSASGRGVTFTLNCLARLHSEEKAATNISRRSDISRSLSLTRTVACRNWRR